jgi:SAM-dependent methyltransferase
MEVGLLTEAGRLYVSATANVSRRISGVRTGSQVKSMCALGSIGDKRMNDNITQSIRESYDRLADEYTRRIFDELQHKPLDRELLSRFASELAGSGEVCDMGCGPGHIARYLHDAGARVFGMDLSPRMLAQARRLNPDICFREGNMMDLNLADGVLAGIAAFYAIVNISNESLPRVFREMERVLQPGGLLLLAFHAGDEIVRMDELWGSRISMGFFCFRPLVIQRYLEGAGFEIEEIIEREPYSPEVEHQSQRAYIFARKPSFCAKH